MDWRTMGLENFGIFQPYITEGLYGIPVLRPETLPDIKWEGFNFARNIRGERFDTGVYFFLDDYQFASVWNNPERYLAMLKRFGAVMTPDFSMYTDMPKALQIYNHYRKHWLGQYWQENGLKVIPTISWSDKDSFEWCFDGEPIGGAVAISTVGVERDKNAYALFVGGYEEMLERLQPAQILVYGKRFDFMTEDGIMVVEPFFKQMKERVNNGR